MKLQPLLTWWLLAPYLVAALAFSGWQFWRLRRKWRTVKWFWLRRTLLIVLPALIALGPSVQGGVSAPGVANLNIIFAVDTTPSMGALDYAFRQQRLEGAKQDLLALSTALQGAHMEIITFDSEANVILPLTSDATAFSTAVNGMTPQINSYSQGSTIDKPLNLISQEFKAIAAAYPERYQLLFYLGDGEQTTDASAKSFAPLARQLTGGAVLGYGTASGAQMVKFTGLDVKNARPSYITTIDETSNRLVPAVSKMDSAALQKIAGELKLTYQDRNQGGPVDGIYRASKAALAIDRSQRVVHYLNLYWLVAIPYVGLIFWEWQNLILKLWGMRSSKQPKKSGRSRRV